MPVTSILQRYNLNEEWFSNPLQLLPERNVWALLDAPRAIEGIDDFGFMVTQKSQLRDYGKFGQAISSSNSVFEAIQTFIKKMPSQTTAPPFWTSRCANYLWFCREGIKNATKGNQQVEQHVLGLMVQTVRLAAGKSWSPSIVHIQSPSLCQSTKSAFLHNSQVIPRKKHTAIAIPKTLLVAPIEKNAVRSIKCEETLPSIGNSLEALIRDMMRFSSSSDRFELQSLSTQLDLHPRKIQRLLKEENTTFRQISGEMRLNSAKSLLEETTLNITDISNDLGFTDQSNFWRAFIKGTGLSPSEYRLATMKK